MLMIGTGALAERLYVAWRERMEFIDPQPYGETSANTRDRGYHFGQSPAYKPRPSWSRLTEAEQAVWKHVAEAVGAVLADAMGAL